MNDLQELKQLIDFLRELNRSHDLTALAEAILRYAISIVPGAQAGSFMVLNENKGVFEFRATVNWELSKLAEVKLPQDQIPKTLFRDEPAISRHPHELEFLESLGQNKAILTFPVIYEGKVIAYFNLGSEDADAFSEADLEQLAAVREEITFAICRVREREKHMELEEKYRTLAENIPDLLVLMDLEGNITYVSKNIEQGMGYTREEIEGQNIRAFLTPESYAFALERIKKWREGAKELPRYVVEVRAKDGRRVPFEASTSPVIKDGKLVAVQILARNISERVQGERELRESEARFRLFFDRLADAVYITTFEGEILEANPAASCQTGYSHDELIGMNIMRDLAAEEPAMTYEMVNQMLARKETVYFQEKKRRKDGTIYWTECAVTPIEYKGRPATLSVNRDITDRKAMEEELKRHIRQLDALNRTGRQILSSLQLNEVLRRIVSLTGEVVNSSYTSIMLLDEKGEPAESFDDFKEIPPFPRRIRPHGMTRKIIITGEPVIVNEVFEDGSTEPPIASLDKPIPANPLLVEAGIKSFAGVPIMAKGVVSGVLFVYSLVPYAFERELLVLTALANQAAIAIENARLYKAAQQATAEHKRLAERLRMVEESSRKMKLVTSRDELYKIVLDSINQILGYHACAVLEVKEDALEVVAEREYLPEARRLRIPLSGEKGITVAAFKSGAPVYVPDVAADPRFLPGVAGAKCEFAIPIIIGERKFGILNVEHSQLDGIPPEDRDLLMIIASELAVGLLSLERLTKVRSLSEKLAGLHQAVQQLQRCTTEEEVVQVAVRVVREILGFEICAIDLVEGDVLIPKATSGLAVEAARLSHKGEDIAAKTWEERRTFWGNMRDFPEAKPAREEFRSFISAPIGDFGVLQVVETKLDAFTEDDVRLVEILVGHLREEIQRVRLEQELREQATHDPLTGAYNRRYFEEFIQREQSRARRYQRPIAFLLLDIDNFKWINDTYGLLTGDAVLQGIGKFLSEQVRGEDILVRWGGDEFLIVLPETGAEIKQIAERIQARLREWSQEKKIVGFPLGCAMGWAVWDPREEKSVDEALREADSKLRNEKNICPPPDGSLGHNSVAFYVRR